MTGEEKAEEYIRIDGTNGEKVWEKIHKEFPNCIVVKSIESKKRLSELLFEYTRVVFLDGLAEGRKEKWHDLRKDPNDLPKDYYEDWVLVITIDCVSNEIYMLPNIAELREDGWHKDDFNYTKISKDTTLSEVIAWCELPKFEE